MSTVNRSLALAALLFVSSVFAGDAAAPKISGINVNGEKVSAEDVKRCYDFYIAGAKQSNNGANRELPAEFLTRVAEQAKQQMVQQTLIRQYVKKNNLSSTPESVKTEVSNIREQIEGSGMTFADFLKNRGINEAAFNEEVGYLTALVDSCATKLDEKKTKEEFEKEKAQIPMRRASHILYMHKDVQNAQTQRSKDDAKALADKAVERIGKGEDFGAIAKESSDCPSKAQGGDLGWFQKTQMVAPFGETVYTMGKVGDVSKVVETQFGYHVIKLTGIRTEEEAYKTFVRQQAQEQAQALLEKMYGEAKVTDEN